HRHPTLPHQGGGSYPVASASVARPLSSAGKLSAIRPAIIPVKIGASGPRRRTPWLIRLPAPEGTTWQRKTSLVSGSPEETSSKARPGSTASIETSWRPPDVVVI